MSFYLEVAKLRAARVLWARLVQERYKPNNPKSLLLRTHCQTSGYSLTGREAASLISRVAVLRRSIWFVPLRYVGTAAGAYGHVVFSTHYSVHGLGGASQITGRSLANFCLYNTPLSKDVSRCLGRGTHRRACLCPSISTKGDRYEGTAQNSVAFPGTLSRGCNKNVLSLDKSDSSPFCENSDLVIQTELRRRYFCPEAGGHFHTRTPRLPG